MQDALHQLPSTGSCTAQSMAKSSFLLSIGVARGKLDYGA